MSTAVEVANADRPDDERAARDPYGDGRIEVDERDFRYVSPGFWLSGLATRLEDATTRLVWGR